MSDEGQTAVDGVVAPVAAPEIQAETVQQPAPEQTDPKPEPARDEKGRFQSRINQLTAERGRAERERDAAIRELEFIRQQTTPQKQTVQTDKPPRLEDFEDINEWSAAIAQHATAVAEKRAREQYQQAAQHTSQQQVFQKYEERERAYAAAHPDYMESVQQLGSAVQFHPALAEVVAASEHGPAVVHYLAQHMDEADRIARLPPLYAVAELARLESKVAAPKQKPVSSAPSPVPTLGGGTTPIAKDPASMTDAEWFAAQNARKRK